MIASVLFLCLGEHCGYVLSEDVKFDVYARAYLDVAEVGVLEGVRNDGDLERVGSGVAHGERHAIDGDRALVDGDISAAAHLLVGGIAEAEVPAAVGIGDIVAHGGGVHMPLDDVPVQAPVHHHGALEVDQVAGLQGSEVGARDGLGNSHHVVGRGSGVDGDHGEAHAIVSDRLVDGQFGGKGAAQAQAHIARFGDYRHDGGGLFNYS